MRNAPSVTFPVGRCRFYALMLALLGAGGLAVLGAWWAGADAAPRWQGVLGGAVWMGWLAFAGWSWLHSPVGQLTWDASALSADRSARPGAWLWRPASSPEGTPLHRVEQVLDLQARMLLRLHHADARSRWVWVARAQDPVRWCDLRRALVASR